MQLTAAKNLLNSDPAAAAGHMETALQLNRETQQELKFIIDELRPAALQGKGLAQALKEYADRWQEHTGIQVETVVSGERSLPLDVEQALYRVLQETLSNIARHAEADTVRLNLSMSPESATLIVADNGRGFDMNAVSSNSHGLTGMKGRLSEVGGTLKVDSTRSTGTTIIAEADSGTAALSAFEQHQPDVVLMDLEMPGEIDGIAATRQIRKTRPQIQVIVVTSHHQDEYIFPAVRAGAISYLLKDVEPDELAAAIRKAAHGEAMLDSRVASRIVQELQGLRKEDVNPFTELSERELDVLRLIAAGKSNAEIAETLVIKQEILQ